MFSGLLNYWFRTQFIEPKAKGVSDRNLIIYLPHFYRTDTSCDIPEDLGAKSGQDAESDWIAQKSIHFETHQVSTSSSQLGIKVVSSWLKADYSVDICRTSQYVLINRSVMGSTVSEGFSIKPNKTREAKGITGFCAYLNDCYSPSKPILIENINT